MYKTQKKLQLTDQRFRFLEGQIVFRLSSPTTDFLKSKGTSLYQLVILGIILEGIMKLLGQRSELLKRKTDCFLVYSSLTIDL